MRLKTFLIPLDGSKLAESVLPIATLMAKMNHARLILFHVIEPHAPGKVHGQVHLTQKEQAMEYLARVRQEIPAEVEVDQHVHTDAQKNVAGSIVAHSQELQVDLIVMCAHGQSGLQKRIFGNIAQSVLASGNVPVLLVSPEKELYSGTCSCKSILVPLDGNPEHEAGLDMAKELAKTCLATLHLVMVIHDPSTLPGEQAASAVLLPNVTSALLDMDCEAGEAYLAHLMGQLLDEHFTVTGEVQRGEPAREIVRAAQEFKSDLIVLATHGKRTMDAFWSGSVTPRLATQTHLPMLLVPVHEDPADDLGEDQE